MWEPDGTANRILGGEAAKEAAKAAATSGAKALADEAAARL